MALFSEFLHASLSNSGYVPSVCMLSAFVVFLWVLVRFNAQRKSKLSLILPPGPFPWPIIGNLYQLTKLPHRDRDDLGKKYGPILMLKLGSFSTVVVSSSTMAKEFLKAYDKVIASRPPSAAGKYLGYNFKDVGLSPYGPYWRHMRKLCVIGLLNSKRIESFRSVREEEAHLFGRSVWEISGQGKRPVNLTNMLASYSLATMWQMLSGNKFSFHTGTDRCNRGEETMKMSSEVFAVIGKLSIGDFIPYLDWMDLQGVKQRMKRVHTLFDQLVKKIIEEHQQRRENLNKEHDGRSFVDELLEMESLDGREITEENIKAIVFDMLIAGVETTSITLAWLMSAVNRNPNVAKKMQGEIESIVGRERIVKEEDVANMEYLHCVVLETLRLYPAGPLLFPHESTQDCTVAGYFINAWTIGRDPSLWEDPLVFRPERFLGRDIDLVRDKEWFDMVPFGAGRRGCPGANMAIVSMKLLSAQLFHCFEWSVEGELDMTEGPGASMPRSTELVAFPRLRLEAYL